ncbi:formamidopyrimidine-DNA glycosylase [Bacillus sp. B3-WWTP-C-10-D-3]|nr:formamidopyrimidine-DNA glycosylase [Bacillus sp. B3-WWTP-C-10-D-3]OTX50044.1 formamidopyrimidine-DNA glycosylase [Bacillus thuringiensis serovar pondicheriensis]PGB53400.1 formamidopyrimidine-DNA glycosylase [Bacillus anthracis]
MKQNHLHQSYQRNSLSTNERNIIFSKQNNTSLLKTRLYFCHRESTLL